jgi:chaperonin GroEL
MKKYLSEDALRAALVRGAQKTEEMVGSTLGPCGASVLIQGANKSLISTKDGATVAKSIILEDVFENMGATVLCQASTETEKKAGDGTTTTVTLAHAILSVAQKYVVAGANPFELKKGVELAVEQAVAKLASLSRPIDSKERIQQIAALSANGDEVIGRLIADAIDQIGADGSLVVENGTALQTVLKVVEGFRLPAGYISQAFLTEEGRSYIKYLKPYFLVTDAKIEFVDDLLPILKLVARENRPLVIVADYVEGQALAALIANATRGTMKVTAINAPFYGEEKKACLRDLALITGATLVSPESGISLTDATLKHLGTSATVEIQKGFSTVIDGAGESTTIQSRIAILQNEIQQSNDIAECEKIQERVSRLLGGIAIIKIGGSTEIEIVEKRFRVDDALEAVRSAQAEGLVPGGGCTLYRLSYLLRAPEGLSEDQTFGFKIVQKALCAPFNKLVKNAGLHPEVLASSLELSDWASEVVYNLREKKVVEAFEAGIIDPTKVLRCALQNGASAALALLTTNYAIAET